MRADFSHSPLNWPQLPQSALQTPISRKDACLWLTPLSLWSFVHIVLSSSYQFCNHKVTCCCKACSHFGIVKVVEAKRVLASYKKRRNNWQKYGFIRNFGGHSRMECGSDVWYKIFQPTQSIYILNWNICSNPRYSVSNPVSWLCASWVAVDNGWNIRVPGIYIIHLDRVLGSWPWTIPILDVADT